MKENLQAKQQTKKKYVKPKYKMQHVLKRDKLFNIIRPKRKRRKEKECPSEAA
jgi:hypothetical protein